MARGRTLTQMGGFLDPLMPGHGPSVVVGQPVMVRMQGVPTMPGYRDRPGKWNSFVPILLIIEVLRRLAEWLR